MSQRRTVFSWLAAVALVLVAVQPSLSLKAFAAGSGGSRVIPGQVPDAVTSAQDTGARNAGDTLSFSIMLPIRDPAGLQQFLQAVNDPSSPQFHQFMTQSEANQAFNPTAAEEQLVVTWLQDNGLAVTHTYPNHLMVDVTGTVGQIEKLLHISIHNFKGDVHGHTGTFFAPTTDPTVPSSVSSAVSNVVGLDSYPRVQLLSNGTAHNSPEYYPQDFANAYDVNPLWSAGYTGSGQHIGITLWEVPPSDSTLTQFGTMTGASVATQANGRLKVIKVDGGTTTADDAEGGLDIESSGGMAPGATIDYYEAPTDASGNPTSQGLVDALNLAGTDANNNRQITNSWGACEDNVMDSWQQALENVFSANAATGHNYFFSSGDNGSWCDPTNNGTGSNPWPDYPASSPNVTSVGGSRFNANISGSYPGESAWAYCSTCNGGHPEGSGGGYSQLFSRPSWQTGPGLAANGKRGYPDISADADPNTGFEVCYGATPTCGGVGGTSLASPLWAGMSALLNQYLAAQGKPSLSFLSPTLYSLANTTQPYAPFHDITSGTNGQYSTGASWDAVTGLGTPDLYNMARDLAGGTTGATPTPGSGTPLPTNTPTGSGGTTQLVTNGGFESGQTPWTQTSAAGYQLITTSTPHSGTHAAWLCGYSSCNDTVGQTVTLPGSVSSLTLTFWLDETVPDSTCGGALKVVLKTTTGTTIATPFSRCSNSATGGYAQQTVSLGSQLQSYAGQQVQVVFAGSSTGSANYFVDDVAMTASSGSGGAPTSTATPIPTATNTPRPTNTSTPVPTNTPAPTSTTVPGPTNTPLPTVTKTAVPTSTSTPLPTTTPTGGGSTVQFLTNGGFESGQTPWSESSAAGYQLVSTSTPHSGTHAAWLCGYSSCNDSIGQTVTLPSSFTALSLTFWLDQTLPDSSCSGALKVVLKTAAGATIATPYSRCSSSATGGYAQQTASLTSALQPYAGQQVQVVFAGTATGSTNYYIDDAALTASGAPGSAPVATSTPTLVPTAVPTATSGSGSPCPGSTTGCAQYMLSILNKDRAANGVAPLTLNLTQTNGTASCVGSLGHSTAMQQSGSIWHTNASYPAASFPTDICVAYTRAGENVGEANYGNELTDLQQLDSMMMSEPHSPGCTGNHACNILYPSFHQVGIGVIYVNNATWLTEDFTN